jgi:hypothetical protein
LVFISLLIAVIVLFGILSLLGIHYSILLSFILGLIIMFL